MNKGEKIGLAFMLTAIFWGSIYDMLNVSNFSVGYLIGTFGIGVLVFTVYGKDA